MLVIAGYGPVAEWIRDCLEHEDYYVAVVGDANAAIRMMTLIGVDMILAWPAVSACTVEDVLGVADAQGEAARVPVLIASWFAPYGLSPLDCWVKAPLGAIDLRLRVRHLLDHGEFMDGSSRMPAVRQPGSPAALRALSVSGAS